jgi:glycosyltransferase involved in cell wall biosynthesis
LNGPHDFVLSQELTSEIVESHDAIIIGNFFKGGIAATDALLKYGIGKDIFKIEFDYGFCHHRSPLLKRMRGYLDQDPFSGQDELRRLYQFLKEHCKMFFYMSVSQRDVFRNELEYSDADDRHFVISSCFDLRTWALVEVLRETPKRNVCAVVSASDDLAKFCKGVDSSIEFAEVNNLDYEVIFEPRYGDFLKRLSGYTRLIFLPNNWDTCPRLLIEARLLGLQTLTNKNSQHVMESWWRTDDDREVISYLKKRPQFFWEMVNSCSVHQKRIKKLSVTLDISVLVVGYVYERARTGIHRVVENIFERLASRSDINLSLVVAYDRMQEATDHFVRARPDLGNRFTVHDLSWTPAGDLFHSPFFQLPGSTTSGPRVLTIYDLIPIKFPHLFEFGEDSSIRNTIGSLGRDDFITVISEATKVDLCAYAPHLDPAHMVVTPLAADSKVFYCCLSAKEKDRVFEKYQLGAAPRYLLSVATLEPRKNIAHLIRAYVRLLNEDEIPDLKLVLVGAKGWKFDAIFDELSLAGDIRDRIIVTGFVPDNDMAALYSNAMAFAYPSLYEGFGLPPLEAMQCGTPVITSDNSSLPEVVGDAGILVPALDEAALVDAIRRLYYDAALRQQLSQKGLARAAMFTWERCVDQTVATYRMAHAHWASRQAVAAYRPKTIVVDAVFFQLYQTGIARVWRTLLQEWAPTDFGKRLVVLDRAGTAPRFDGIKYLAVPRYDYANTDSDRAMLQRVCDAENAAVFISSYYTTPVTTPSIFMVHDMIPELVGVDVVNTPMWREKHFGVRHAQRFIAVSNNTAKDLRQFFPNITPDQITVAHNGVDFKQQGADAVAAFRGAYGVDRPYFLLVGARDGYKNTTLFFKAFAALGAVRARFSIVCTGPAIELEPQHAVAIGGAKVHMLNLSDAELQCAYSGAVALVYPSLYEGFGMPILEAMACGSPVITTRKGSIPEVAGDAALYVDGADVGEMTRALKHVQKAQVRKRFVELGLKRAASFSWRKMADQVQQVLEKALTKESVEQIASKADQPMDATQTILMRREQALGMALQYHQAGQFDQADSIYLELLDVNANDFVALHLHGVVLHQRGDFSQAEEFLRRALVVNNVTPAAHHNLGNVYLSQGRIDEARACFTKAITLDPNFELALVQLTTLDKAQH